MSDDGYMDRARQLLESKLEAVRALAATRARLGEAEAALATARREDGVAGAAALRAGWSEGELRTVGLPVSGASGVRPVRPSRARPAVGVEAGEGVAS